MIRVLVLPSNPWNIKILLWTHVLLAEKGTFTWTKQFDTGYHTKKFTSSQNTIYGTKIYCINIPINMTRNYLKIYFLVTPFFIEEWVWNSAKTFCLVVLVLQTCELLSTVTSFHSETVSSQWYAYLCSALMLPSGDKWRGRKWLVIHVIQVWGHDLTGLSQDRLNHDLKAFEFWLWLD